MIELQSIPYMKCRAVLRLAATPVKSRVVEIFACPSHSWTLAISASRETALVAARRPHRMYARPIYFNMDAGLTPIFHDDVPIATYCQR